MLLNLNIEKEVNVLKKEKKKERLIFIYINDLFEEPMLQCK